MRKKVPMSIDRRKVFYISGFDPRGARHYHNLFVKEALRFEEKSGVDLTISSRVKESDEEISWQTIYTNEGGTTISDHTMLAWDDIIRQNWLKNPFDLLTKSIRAYFDNIIIADWKTAIRLSRAPIITLGYPLLVLFVLGLLIFSFSQYLFFFTTNTYIRLLGVGVLFFAAYKLFSIVKAPWLLRLFIINNRMARAPVKEIENRCDLFTAIIQDAADRDEYDEILLIGHSNGATFLAPIISRLIKKGVALNKIHVVSLGHCIPLVSLSKKALYYKDHLKTAALREFLWLDIGAAADGTCYAMVGPYKGAIDDSEMKTELVLKSPRFHASYEAKKYNKMKINKYAFHFLYLTCPDILGSYDYFTMTTAHLGLRSYIKTLK
jgi:hypothetical protein